MCKQNLHQLLLMAALYWNTSTFVKSTKKIRRQGPKYSKYIVDLVHPKGNWKNLKTKGTACWYKKSQQRRHDWWETLDGTELSIVMHLFTGGSTKTVWILLLIWILDLTSFWTLDLFLYLAHSLSLVSIFVPCFLEWKFVAASMPSWEQVFQCLSAIMSTNRFNSSKSNTLRN